jgi:16S rRNA (uracil1498-N3)-methyltransferase
MKDGARGHRFYVAAEALQGDSVCITGVQAHQICRVLRLRPGDAIRVFHGTATEYLVTLERVEAEAVHGRIRDQWEPATEATCRLWLAVPLLKSEKLEWVIQKSVELGACGILLMRTRRTVVSADDVRTAARRERYRRIAVEATEQCGRLHVPVIEGPDTWTEALARATAAEAAFIAHEGARTPLQAAITPSPRLRSGILYTGPEGGFTDEEIREAEGAGILPISLGPRILRAETAPVVGLALLLSVIEA